MSDFMTLWAERQKKKSGQTASGTTNSTGTDFMSLWKARKENKPTASDVLSSYYQEVQDYVSRANKDESRLGHANAESILRTNDSASQYLLNRGSRIQAYLNNSGADESTRQAFADYLAQTENMLSGYGDYFGNANDIYSQFATQNDYDQAVKESGWYNTYGGKTADELLAALGNLEKDSDEYKWVAGYYNYQDTQQKLDYDTAEGQSQIEAMESDLAKFEELTAFRNSYRDYLDNGGEQVRDMDTQSKLAQYDQLARKYGSIENLNQQLTEARKVVGQAERLQTAEQMESVSSLSDFASKSAYASTELDTAWQKMWSEGGAGYGDATYEFINNTDGVREKVRDTGSKEKWRLLEKMTPEEVAVYNYHYATGGKAEAEKYIDSIVESLSARRAVDIYAPIEGKTGRELLFGVGAGLNQFSTGTASAFSGADYIPTNSMQYASDMVREDLGYVGFKLPKWMGGASVGQAAYDTITTTANMAPSIAASLIHPTLGTTLMGVSAGGNAYQEKLNAGYSKEDARAYASLVGASEALLERVLGGITQLGGGNITAALSGLDNALGRFAQTAGGKILANAGSEALEEFTQSVIEPYLWNAVSGEQTSLDWEEALYSAMLGFATGGMFEGAKQASVAINDIGIGRTVKKTEGGLANLNAAADSVSSTATPAVQSQIARAKEKAAKGGARAAGQLYNTVSAEVTKADTADIVKSLNRKGIKGDAATQIADLIVNKLSANGLTSYGEKLFNEAMRDKRVQTVVSDLIDNKMSTVGQRNQKLAAATGKEASTIDVAKVKERQRTEFVEENNEYNVAADQQTINTKTGAAVKVNDIAEITDKGVVNVQLDDGSVVNAADLSYATEDIALAYSALKGKPMSAENANRLFKMSEGMDAAEFYEAVEDGYERGYANLAKPEGEVAAAAYEAGAAQRASEGGKSKAKTNASGINYISKKGDVTKIDTVGKSKDLSLNKRQRAAVNTMQTLQKLNLGTAFYLFESRTEIINGEERIVFTDEYGKRHEAPNGMYYKDGRIYIDINAGAGRNGRIMLQTVAHELTHHIQEWNSAKYKVLADFLAAEYGKRGVDTYSAIKAKQQELSEVRGSTVSFNEAYHEFVADSLSVMFNDGNLYNKLVKLKQTDSALFNELNDFVSKLAEKVRKLFNNDRAETAEGRFVQSWDVEAIERLQQTFAEALVEASGNYESALNSVAKPDAKPISNNEIITDGVTVTDGVGKQLSVKSMKADIAEGKMFDDLKRVLKWSDAKVNALRTNLTNLVNYMAREEVRGIVDMNESYGREGRRFSPFKPNSDPLYKISLDFSTLCSKRLLTQFVIENLQLREKRPMTAEEQMAIRAMLNEYRKVENGLQVACAMCYVEAARLKSPKQIQRWLDNPEPLLRDYFAKKNKEFNDSVKEAQADFKESRGYDRNATKKDMKGSDIKELNKIGPRMRANYKLSAEESAIVERALKLPEGTYLTAANLATLSETEPVIYNAYSSFVRTATRSKGLETDEPYYYGDSTRDNGNGIIVSDSFIEDVNRENGMRFSSWSDWRIQHMLDYITTVIDMSVRGAAMHGYTKFGDEVRVLGKTGMMFNMSGVAGTQTGLNADGSLSFSETESIDADEAIQLREEFPDTAGLQCIGVSKEHIVALLASDIIDYVIPYHTSGLNAALRRMADIHGWKDFTGTQNASVDKSVKYEDAVDQEHWHEEPVFSEFFVGYNTGMTGIEAMRQSAENYKRMCRERGMTPKFNEFANEENYWKLLIDRKMINQKTGNLIKQMPVTPEFDFDLIKDIVDKTVTNYDSGMESRALNHIVENWDTIPQRIRDLKKKGTAKAKKTAKAVDTLSNQTLAAMPKEKNVKNENDLPKVQMATRLDPRQVKERDVLDLVERSMYEFDEGTYIPVRATTPPILSYVVWKHTKETFMPQNLPMIMEVGKVRQATEEDDGIVYENNKPHGITPTGMVEIFKQMGDPAYIVYQPNRRYVEIVRYRDRTGHAALASIDLFGLNEKARPINPEYMNGYEGGVYNFVVTTYNPDDLPGYLNDPENLVLYDKQKGLPERGSGSKLPSHLTDKPFYEDIVPHDEDGVNTEDSQTSDRLSEPSTTSTNITEEMRQRGEKAIATATAQREAKVAAEQKTHRAIRAALTNRDLIAQIEGKTELEKRKLKEYNDALVKSREFSATVTDLNRQIKEAEESNDPKKAETVKNLTFALNKAKANKKTMETKLSRMENKELEPLVARERVRIIEELRKEYGTIPAGENPVRDDSLPTSTDGENFVSRTARTVKGAGVTPDDFADLIDTEVAKGGLTYIRITNDEATQRAVEKITKNGWEQARAEWSAAIKAGKASAEMSAMGALLLNNAAKAGDKKAWLDILHDYQQMGTNAAQAVQAMRILKSLAPSDKLYMAEKSLDALVDNLNTKGKVKLNEELKRKYLNAKTDAERDAIMGEIQQDIANQIPPTLKDKWTALRYLNMLGNLRTQVRNIVGNTSMGLTVRLKDLVATGIEGLAYVASNGKFERTKALLTGKKLRKAASADYDFVADIIATGGKFNDANNANSAFIRGVMEKRRIFFLKFLEKYRTRTNWAMDKGDVLFSRAAYASALAGYLKAHGVTETDFDKIDKAFLDKARLYAVQEAQEATFHDINAVSEFVTRRYRGENKAGKALNLALEGIMPFRKTPANIVVRAWEYSPLGITNALVMSAKAFAKDSDVTGAQIVNTWSKALTGSGLFVAGLLLASSGHLIGGPDDDEAEDKFQQLNGEQNYALKLGKTYITIDWASPSAIPLFMGAQLYQLTQENGFQLRDLETALTSIADPLVEMSMLQGLNDTIDNIKYSDNKLMQLAINAIVGYFTQGLTNTMLGQIERSFEKSRSTTYVDKNKDLPDWLQRAIGKASAKIPGFWDYNQIAYINAWGEEEENPGILRSLVYNMLSPSYITEDKTDAVSTELQRLEGVNTTSRSVYPSAAGKKFTFTDKDGVVHKDYQLSADEYVALAKNKGQTQRKLVENMIASQLYKDLPDLYKAKAIQTAYTYAHESSQIEVLNRDGFSSKWMGEIKGDVATGILEHIYEENAKDMYLAGEVTAGDAAKVLQNYSGLAVAESSEKVAYWDFQEDYPEYKDLSQSAVTDYYDFAKPSGISVSVYYDYCTKAKGKTKKDERMSVIDSLPLSKKQKDALYLANGWAESKLNEAPWH